MGFEITKEEFINNFTEVCKVYEQYGVLKVAGYFNLEQIDNSSQAEIGSSMTQSSGIFTFPSTGLYKINFNMQGFAQADDNVLGYIYTTTNNSSYTADAIGYLCGDGSTQGSAGTLAEYFFNVTNTSTHKIKFNLASIASTTSGVFGSTTINNTCFTFIRLGDSV